jgi:hypothetical protein
MDISETYVGNIFQTLKFYHIGQLQCKSKLIIFCVCVRMCMPVCVGNKTTEEIEVRKTKGWQVQIWELQLSCRTKQDK